MPDAMILRKGMYTVADAKVRPYGNSSDAVVIRFTPRMKDERVIEIGFSLEDWLLLSADVLVEFEKQRKGGH